MTQQEITTQDVVLSTDRDVISLYKMGEKLGNTDHSITGLTINVSFNFKD